MKQHYRRSKESQLIDPDFADFTEALKEGNSNRHSSNRQAERKTLQFCRQVQRALNLALENLNAGADITGLFVEDVSPAPDCGRLLVRVAVSAGLPVAEAISALHRAAPRLRSEVAMAISRKRAPELSFIPAFDDGGGE